MITEDAKSMSSMSSDEEVAANELYTTNGKKSKVNMEKEQLDVRVTTDIDYSQNLGKICHSLFLRPNARLRNSYLAQNPASEIKEESLFKLENEVSKNKNIE